MLLLTPGSTAAEPAPGPPASASGAPALDLAGPPAPPARELLVPPPKSRELLNAEAAWRWYAAGWAINTASTIAAIELAGAREANPLFRGRPTAAIAAKAAVAAVGWRLEVWSARRGHPRGGRIGRWIFVGISALVAGYEFSVAF